MTTPTADRPLPLAIRLVIGLVFATGVAIAAYLGIVIGMIMGLVTVAPAATAPRPSIGLAPDLSGVVDMFVSTGAGGILGAIAGLIVGVVVMWLLCGMLLTPLAKRLLRK